MSLVAAIFLKILNMSLTAGWLILAVLVVRMLIKRAPRRITCFLWALVGIRLMLPVSVKSIFSLIPNTNSIPADIALSPEPGIDTGISLINNAVNPIIADSLAPNIGDSANPLQIWTVIAAIVWLIGVSTLLIYALISYLRLRNRVSASIPVKEGVKACDEIDSPFILGIIKPVIYVPSDLNSASLDHVLRHEYAHLRRGDHIWKPMGFLLLTLHWFNPLCWIAYILLCRDIESACDEKVIDGLNKEAIAEYANTLLECARQKRIISAYPVAFGETDVKGRVKNVLKYRKPALWITVSAVVVYIVVAVCFLTDPKDENIKDVSSESTEIQEITVSVKPLDREMTEEKERKYREWLRKISEETGVPESKVGTIDITNRLPEDIEELIDLSELKEYYAEEISRELGIDISPDMINFVSEPVKAEPEEAYHE